MTNTNINTSHLHIPKIIHQLWIGPKPRPSKFMTTWKEKHPDYEYIMWNEEEIHKRGLELECVSKINTIEEIKIANQNLLKTILYFFVNV